MLVKSTAKLLQGSQMSQKSIIVPQGNIKGSQKCSNHEYLTYETYWLQAGGHPSNVFKNVSQKD